MASSSSDPGKQPSTSQTKPSHEITPADVGSSPPNTGNKQPSTSQTKPSHDITPADIGTSSSPNTGNKSPSSSSSSTKTDTEPKPSPKIYLGSSSLVKRKLGLKPKIPFVELGTDEHPLAKKDFSILAWNTLEAAGVLAFNHDSKTPVVKPEHVLKSLLNQEDGLVGVIIAKLGIDVDKVKNITNEYNPTGKSDKDMLFLMSSARDYQRKYKSSLVCPEHIFLAFAKDKRIGIYVFRQSGITKEGIKKFIKEMNAAFQDSDIKVGDLKKSLEKLGQFGTDLTGKAKVGSLDPVVGRKLEIQTCLDILQARRGNNPILIGEAGVGKTAVVEGIAQRIVQGEVPKALKNCSIISLDLAALMAGASMVGMFEERLKTVLREGQKSNGRIILFIDEIHLLIGTGAQRGPMDAANILKPLLARGELCCIGATTLSEYQRYFEKDSALARRFRTVYVKQPSTETSILILRGLQESYELHHGVRFDEGVAEDCVMYSNRYISSNCLPDKAIELLDQSATYLKSEITSCPSMFNDDQREISKLEYEEKSDPNEERAGKLSSLRKEHAQKLQQWEYEKTVIRHIQLLKKQIREVEENVQKLEFERRFDAATNLQNGALKLLLNQLKISTEEFDKREVESIIIRDKVVRGDIGRIISEKTGIPASNLLKSEKDKLLEVSTEIRERIAGQNIAVESVIKAMQASRSKISKPNRPTCSLMFLGPPGVGKSELAKTLASYMFNSEDALVRLDMSEYKDSSSISKLIGAAPRLVGYEARGYFELVRMRPYSVVLFDEIEKAHDNVKNLLLQVLSDGRVMDSHQSVISFTNTIIIMTSNIGGKDVTENKDLPYQTLKEMVMESVKDSFSAEFIDRIDEFIIFQPLNLEEMTKIARLQLGDLTRRADSQKIKLEFDDDVSTYVGGVAHAVSCGGREVNRIIRQKVEAEINILLFEGELGEGDTVRVSIGTEQDKEIIVFNKIVH